MNVHPITYQLAEAVRDDLMWELKQKPAPDEAAPTFLSNQLAKVLGWMKAHPVGTAYDYPQYKAIMSESIKMTDELHKRRWGMP